MGTPKRERKKAARQAKLEQLAAEQRRQKRKRQLIRLGLVAVGFAVVVVVLVQLFGGDEDTTVTTDTTGTTVTASTTTPTEAGPTTVFAGETPCPDPAGEAVRATQFAQAPPTCIDPARTYTAEVVTNKGSFTITLDAAAAPATVNNFVVLSRFGFYDGTPCHRVVRDFVVQCGDPTGTGTGGPGYTFDDELPASGAYELGSVAMANSGPDTNGSQFFIITGPDGVKLPPNYSLFGKVTAGFDTTVAAMAATAGDGDGPPTEPLVIESVTITEA